MVERVLVDAIFGAIGAVLRWVFSALPVSSLTGVTRDVTAAASSIGGRLHPWDAYLPLSELVAMAVVLVGVWLPCLLLYIAANWVWRHIPDLFGFGPGSG